jgi:hypothetical protein
MKNKTIELLNHIKTLPSNMYFNIDSNFFIDKNYNIIDSTRLSTTEIENFLSTNLLKNLNNLEIFYTDKNPCITYNGSHICNIYKDVILHIPISEDAPSYNLMFEHFNIIYPLQLIFAYTIINPTTDITELPIIQNKDSTIKVYDFDNNINKCNEFIDYINSKKIY